MPKRTTKNLLIKILLVLFGIFPYVKYGCFVSNNQVIEVFFSPSGGCLQEILDSINDSQKEILIQAFSFTSKKILEALILAKHRGIVVKCIMDKNQSMVRGSLASLLYKNIDDFVIDSAKGYAHSKVIIIDRKIVFTGSYNFTNNAEYFNRENLLKINNTRIANLYTKEWHRRRDAISLHSSRKEIRNLVTLQKTIAK